MTPTQILLNTDDCHRMVEEMGLQRFLLGNGLDPCLPRQDFSTSLELIIPTTKIVFQYLLSSPLSKKLLTMVMSTS